VERIIHWLNKHFVVMIVLIIILVGISVGMYRWGYNTGVDDFAQTTLVKGIDTILEDVSDDPLLNVANQTIKLAMFEREVENNDALYNAIAEYFKELADSGKLRELVK
jgi:tetraacyldisaccharide-1-P 4'-kinase